MKYSGARYLKGEKTNETYSFDQQSCSWIVKKLSLFYPNVPSMGNTTW